MSKLNGRIIMKAVAGSHLFGTDGPNSDRDYKGVYLPDGESILLGNYPETIQQSSGDPLGKNSKDDVDIELYSVTKFLKMVSKGDTAALELLFTPDHLILERTSEWDYILSKRNELLSSQVSAMIGYARQQANKYGIKGSRMGELNTFISAMKTAEKLDLGPKLKHCWEYITKAVNSLDHVHLITLKTIREESGEIPAIDVLGKKFDHNVRFDYMMPILKRIYKNYGQRAREAKNNNGIDWKALSHALRVCRQGIELLETGSITLPLEELDREVVKAVKAGVMNYKKVAHILKHNLNLLEEARNSSTLPEQVDPRLIRELTIRLHKGAIDELG